MILKATICMFLLAISLEFSNGTRILLDTTSDVTHVAPLSTNEPDTSSPIDESDTPVENPTPTLPSGQIPATIAHAPVVGPTKALPTRVAPTVGTTTNNVAPMATPVGVTPTGGLGATGGGVVSGEHPTLSFFMHDVLGRTHATSRVGFYLSSSLDGSSHTFALTTLFHGSDHEMDDTISFFRVHRTASEISHIAVIGGTGKYDEAKGYATIESLPQVDEHTTDGVETIVHVNVYLTTS
ncbi:hypothetical protein L1987_78877 [Smallanthus sonchifolius]|uniref:Uncharacterized protein n=1 Tax=Smallanthus sonchifolius TaxID=185202 RepID=A0ACB8ZEX7_9ASTR|nr:hypothetical protein L1987_78877 [Smallanthus sonchifolius]